jgi:hypothetical protein
MFYFLSRNRDSSVGIAMGYGLDSRGSIPGRARNSFPLHSVQTGSEDHPFSYTIGNGSSFLGDKTAVV